MGGMTMTRVAAKAVGGVASCGATPTRLGPSSSSVRRQEYHRHGRRGRLVRVKAVEEVASADAAASPSELVAQAEMRNVVNKAGCIQPEEAESNASAFVVAIYDDDEALQYVGFSKDIRNTLRKLLCRRPEVVAYYRAVCLPEVDQAVMLAVRESFWESNGGAPEGNSDARIKVRWEQPVDGGAVSNRGFAAAAKNKARELMELIKKRGVREQIDFDPDLMETKGQCEVLDSEALSAEELQEMRERADALLASMVTATGEYLNGMPFEYNFVIDSQYETNGGIVCDVIVTYDDKETEHRVVLGKDFYESVGETPMSVLMKIFTTLISKRVPLRTEGMLGAEDFPSSYFSISQVAAAFPDFKEKFKKKLPEHIHFMRLGDFGNQSADNEMPDFYVGPYQPYLETEEGFMAQTFSEGDQLEHYDPFSPSEVEEGVSKATMRVPVSEYDD